MPPGRRPRRRSPTPAAPPGRTRRPRSGPLTTLPREYLDGEIACWTQSSPTLGTGRNPPALGAPAVVWLPDRGNAENLAGQLEQTLHCACLFAEDARVNFSAPRAAAALAVAVLVAGCASGPAGSSAPPASPRAARTASASP